MHAVKRVGHPKRNVFWEHLNFYSGNTVKNNYETGLNNPIICIALIIFRRCKCGFWTTGSDLLNATITKPYFKGGRTPRLSLIWKPLNQGDSVF